MDFPLQPYDAVPLDASTSYDRSERLMPFAMPVSSYFRRPSKIVKSRNQSPKHLIRRRTTAAIHGPPRNLSMDQMIRRTHPSEPADIPDRPLSWHPTSYEQPIDFSQNPQLSFFPHLDFSTSPYSTTEINGLITPMSTPATGEPYIEEYMAPLEDSSSWTYPNQHFVPSYTSKTGAYYMPEQGPPIEQPSTIPEQVPYGYHYTMPPTYQMQAVSHLQLNIDTAPPSPTLLPTQNFDYDGSASPFLLGSPRIEKDDLVGMGLYDRPQDILSSTLFSGEPTSVAALTAGIGKGLKLEESFEPAPADDEDEEEEQEDQEDTVDTVEQEAYADLRAPISATNDDLLLPQLYGEHHSDYAGQTFFPSHLANQYHLPAVGQFVYPHYQGSEWFTESDRPYGWI